MSRRLLKTLIVSVLLNPVLLLHSINVLIYCLSDLICSISAVHETFPTCNNLSRENVATLILDVNTQTKRAWLFTLVMIGIQHLVWRTMVGWDDQDDTRKCKCMDASSRKEGANEKQLTTNVILPQPNEERQNKAPENPGGISKQEAPHGDRQSNAQEDRNDSPSNPVAERNPVLSPIKNSKSELLLPVFSTNDDDDDDEMGLWRRHHSHLRSSSSQALSDTTIAREEGLWEPVPSN